MSASVERNIRTAGEGSEPPGTDPVRVEAALQLLIDHLEQGLAVTDGCGRAYFLNRAAQAAVARGLLRLEHGILRGATGTDSATLRGLIARCSASRSGGSARLASAGGTLLVAACPIAEGAMLLRFTDPATTRLPEVQVLQDQFGFTPAEAALARDILAGNDLAASAARRGITLNTARVHLRRIFEKTGTRRQAELMRLLLLCPHPIAASEAGPARDGASQGSLARHGLGTGPADIRTGSGRINTV
ncbi:DNA-binding transcriptional regulator, CsgD family [Methylobacterium phyllostachyos]|uniref:DNA-binding transcriptional regulator, CsgD family n=1 Tax=Methylobacterium phyllostachyos TaxID=582672 RepID=A0A1H0DES7_9HYPH|nr:helix-turn-helix transcriptional regulator [Methylobacterium phyllostachyos]SDN68757.1 DNA-binding transcriptional regulator, CsgD family [Methylobacterium phyllostachyos]